MICRDAVHLVEAIATGDLEVADDVRAHFESCPRCAAELAAAQRLEALLQGRGTAEPPARFTPMVLARIRDDQWRSEQRVDRIFNVAIVAAVLLIVGGLAAMTNVSGVLTVSVWVWDALAQVSGNIVEAAAPVLLTYIAAAGILMSALLMWWWADQRLSL